MSRYTHEGPRWYRGRIRSRGPLVGLLPPAVVGLVALALLNLGGSSGTGLTGLILGVLAAPALLAVGAPFSSTSLIPLGIGLSVLLWLFVGFISGRRATRNPMATWRDFWRDYTVLAIGVAAGAGVGLVVARHAVGGALI